MFICTILSPLRYDYIQSGYGVDEVQINFCVISGNSRWWHIVRCEIFEPMKQSCYCTRKRLVVNRLSRSRGCVRMAKEEEKRLQIITWVTPNTSFFTTSNDCPNSPNTIINTLILQAHISQSTVLQVLPSISN